MADVDEGARPKEPKIEDSQNMGDVIKSLEREEKDLRRELKKLTLKKGTLAKANTDLSALQAERDELKRQVLLKRECPERLKVNKEIQELKKELASLDSPQATGGAPKVTIKDLSKMDSLKSVVDSNLEPTYFDDEDNEDSQEEISEGKSSHKTRKIKSGKAAKSSEISVKSPQH